MSRPQVQLKLLVRPSHLAGCCRSLIQGRSIALACRPVTSTTLTDPLNVLQPRSVGGNLIFSMSSSRDASLGHSDFSRAAQSPDLATEEVGDVRQPFSDLRKAPADGRSR